MTGAADEDLTGSLTPDEAFANIGNETRIHILQALGQAEPLTFSELYDAVDIQDTGNFTYHLDKLTGHFVRESDGKYGLREPGGIIVQAILSGVVTANPGLEPTRIESGCPYCGNPVEVSFTDERVLVRCTECPGTYAGGGTDARFLESHPHGTIAIFRLPPAGLSDRAPEQVLNAALARTHLELLELAHGLCPGCSATVTADLQICEDHNPVEGICETCNRRRAMYIDYQCTNCIRVEENIPAGLHFVEVPELMSFISGHGINPVTPTWDQLDTVLGYEEDIQSLNPVEAELTYTVNEDVIKITTNDSLRVTGVSLSEGTRTE